MAADRHRGVEPALADPQVVQQPQGLPGEVAELGVVPLGLQLGDHDDGEHHVVVVEAEHGARVRQQDGGVKDERLGRRGRGVPVVSPEGVRAAAAGELVDERRVVAMFRLPRRSPTGCAYSQARCRDRAPTRRWDRCRPSARSCSRSIGGLPNAGQVPGVSSYVTTDIPCAWVLSRRVGPGASCPALRRAEAASGRAARGGTLRTRSAARARRRRAGPAGSPRAGSRARTPRRSRTRCARSARAGTRPGAARRRCG